MVLFGLPVAHAAQSASASVTIEIQAITPQVARPGDTLTVRATLRNPTAAPIDQITASLSVYRYAFSSRSSLDGWELQASDGSIGTIVVSDQAKDPLGPGQSREVTLTVPADSIGLLRSPDGWGPRGLAVSVTSGRARLGVARSFLLWLPSDSVPATRLSIVVPLTEAPGAAAPFGPSSRLTAVLAATEQHRDIAWAVDPAVVNRAIVAVAAGRGWLTRFHAALLSRDVYSLPYADSDAAALAHADQPKLYLDAAAIGQQQLESALGGANASRLAWPANSSPDLSTIDLAARSKPAVVLLGSADVEAVDSLTYTPTGRSQVTTQSGDVDLVLSDAVLTGQLTDPGGRTPAVAAQRVLAETAMITRERPTTARHVLAALPRDWLPVVASTSAQLTALDNAPWVDLTPLATLIGTPPVDVRRNALPFAGPDPGELSAGDAARIGQATVELDAFGSVPTDRAAALGSLPTDLLDLTSVGWRGYPDARSAAIDIALAKVTALTGSVSVVKSSVVNLIAARGEIPVSLHNGLDQPARVLVRLQPRNARLVATAAVPVEIPAGETASVKVPVHAVANGDVAVDVVVLTPSGALLMTGDRFTVRVRADWENLATAVVAVLLAIGVVIGIFRTARRGRRETRLSVAEARAETEDAPGVAEEMALIEQRDEETVPREPQDQAGAEQSGGDSSD